MIFQFIIIPIVIFMWKKYVHKIKHATTITPSTTRNESI